MGYFTASIEWAHNINQPDAWKQWWYNPQAKIYNFIGKDNIPFHTVIWPAMILAHGELNLPYDVPANQYLTMGGTKASKSRGGVLWLPEYLERYDADPLRYMLTANAPI